MFIIGIDNGVSGSIGVINTETNKAECFLTPIKKCLNYTKNKQWMNRIDVIELCKLLEKSKNNSKAFIERPMVNPARFKATVSALRAMEATLIVLEELAIPYEYIDSRVWQKMLLPTGIKGSSELKRAGIQVAGRLFPDIKLTGDGDGLLIAEYGRRKANSQI